MTDQNNVAIAELQQKANEGDAPSQFALGLYFLPKTPSETKEGWEFVNSLFAEHIARLIMDDKCPEPEIDTAFAASNEHITNVEFAFKWFRKAAEQGNSRSQYAASRCYFEGIGIDQNDASAYDWAQKAAEQQFAEAYCLLGDLYSQGRGVERNDERALSYYRYAVNKGIKGAYGKWMKMVLKAKGVIDYSKASDDVGNFEKYIKKRLDLNLQELSNHRYFEGEINYAGADLIEAPEDNEEPFDNTLDRIEDDTIWLNTTLKEVSLVAMQYKRELEEKNRELNNLIAMFAHNFLGTLQCIRSNAEHDNNPAIHLKTVKMMGGALTAFSILSADDDKLVEQLKQDNTGEIGLQQNLANNLALAISQMLGKTNKDKIINLYLYHLRKTKQIGVETGSEELRVNNEYRKMWQALQHQWEDEFNKLFSENAGLPLLQKWLTDNFFPVEITGFDSNTISFREYGITDSIFLIVFMEIFVNALKYMDVSKNEPLTLMLCEEEHHYKLICENPSTQETGRGTHKGMDFLSTIAKKLGGQFITEVTGNSFRSTFTIPSVLLK